MLSRQRALLWQAKQRLRPWGFVPEPHYEDARARFALTRLPRGLPILIGDSHVAVADWTSLLGRAVHNLGIGGDSTEGVLHRLADVEPLLPAPVVVLVGFNDLARGRPVGSVATDHATIVRELTERHGSPVVVVSLFPVGARHPLARTLNRRIERMNVRLEGAAASCPETTYVDVHRRMVDRGHLAPRHHVDEVHLSSCGYAIVRDAIGSALPADGR